MKFLWGALLPIVFRTTKNLSILKLSILIVNYNVTQLLRNCLESIQRYVQDVDYEVIVIDNQSPDSSWKELIPEFPLVKFVENSANEGFAKANNKAAKMAKGEYILLLNPDTEFESDCMKEILDFADAKTHFGCLGVRFHDLSGDFLPECKRSVPDVFNSFEKLFSPFQSKKSSTKGYYRNDLSETEIAEVEIITGAFLLMKKDLYLEIGGLDEAYFMYGEDIDLCYTILRKGYQNWYYGKHSILHIKGESTVKDREYLENFYGAMHIFIEKYYKKQSPIQYQFLKLGLQVRHLIARLQLK